MSSKLTIKTQIKSGIWWFSTPRGSSIPRCRKSMGVSLSSPWSENWTGVGFGYDQVWSFLWMDPMTAYIPIVLIKIDPTQPTITLIIPCCFKPYLDYNICCRYSLLLWRTLWYNRMSEQEISTKAIDKISDLQEDILILILFSLPIKQAFVTSILLKWWTHIRYFVPNLDFTETKWKDR